MPNQYAWVVAAEKPLAAFTNKSEMEAWVKAKGLAGGERVWRCRRDDIRDFERLEVGNGFGKYSKKIHLYAVRWPKRSISLVVAQSLSMTLKSVEHLILTRDFPQTVECVQKNLSVGRWQRGLWLDGTEKGMGPVPLKKGN